MATIAAILSSTWSFVSGHVVAGSSFCNGWLTKLEVRLGTAAGPHQRWDGQLAGMRTDPVPQQEGEAAVMNGCVASACLPWKLSYERDTGYVWTHVGLHTGEWAHTCQSDRLGLSSTSANYFCTADIGARQGGGIHVGLQT